MNILQHLAKFGGLKQEQIAAMREQGLEPTSEGDRNKWKAQQLQVIPEGGARPKAGEAGFKPFDPSIATSVIHGQQGDGGEKKV